MTTPTIAGLDDLVARLAPGDRRVFERIFRVDTAAGRLAPPSSMQAWIEERFGGLEPVLDQRVVKVTNRVTLQGALFNPLRSLRPQPAALPVDLARELTPEADPLAGPEATTPADTFGRIRGEHCLTAANVAKFDGLHGLVIFDEPHPLRFDRAQVRDYLATARRWIERAHDSRPAAVYPLILWNCLWRAGSSLPHGHLQLVLGEGSHYAKIERLRRDAETYSERHRSSYFDDLYRAHRAVGAAFAAGPIRIIASLTPTKEREVVLLAGRWEPELSDRIYDVLAHLRDDLGVASFNLALAPPPLTPGERWQGFPVLAWIVDRGDPGSRTADFGAMELYGASVVGADPLALAASLRSRVQGVRQ